jgi:hypothetical protein
MADNPGFRDFVSTLNPGYGEVMPKATSFARRAIKIWKVAVPMLAAVFALHCLWMALSEDGWTAPGGVGGFSGVVGNWIGDDWVMHTSLLACRHMRGLVVFFLLSFQLHPSAQVV